MLSKREMKGIRLVVNNHVFPVSQTTFIVRSESNPDKSYRVTWQKKKWCCTCEDFLKHKKACKHVYAVRYYMLLQSLTSGTRHTHERPHCPNCKSRQFVIKRGFRYNKSGPVQRYFCKRCKVKFVDRTAFRGMKNKAAAIVSALDLYFRGVSLRQIAEHLELTYGIKVSHSTVYNWIKKYVQIVNSYVKGMRANCSVRWHMDDTVVRVSGRHMVVWGLLDSETRFLLALRISGKRGAEEAEKLIKEGLTLSTTRPIELVSDGLSSYQVAIEREFRSKGKNNDVIHIKGPLTAGFNNKIERFNGLLKNRVKTMGGFQNEESVNTFTKGFQVYYNFIKGHKSLGGKTPAQVAGLVSKKKSWLDLILDAGGRNVGDHSNY